VRNNLGSAPRLLVCPQKESRGHDIYICSYLGIGSCTLEPATRGDKGVLHDCRKRCLALSQARPAHCAPPARATGFSRLVAAPGALGRVLLESKDARSRLGRRITDRQSHSKIVARFHTETARPVSTFTFERRRSQER
jgi:hypothetical protein